MREIIIMHIMYRWSMCVWAVHAKYNNTHMFGSVHMCTFGAREFCVSFLLVHRLQAAPQLCAASSSFTTDAVTMCNLRVVEARRGDY